MRCYERVAEVLAKWARQDEATFFKYCDMVEAELK